MRRYIISYELSSTDLLSVENFRLHFSKTLIDMGCHHIKSHIDGCVLFNTSRSFDDIKDFIMEKNFIKYIYFTMAEITGNGKQGEYNSFEKSNKKHEEVFDELIEILTIDGGGVDFPIFPKR